jgi:CheY-like chemotaxis protein
MKLPILLLDDDQKWLEIYRSKLPQTTYTLETTSSFSEALRRLEARRYPLVISDLRLIGIGERGGFELLTRAKTISEYTKVMIITAYGGAATDIAREAMAKGAISYFTKPLDFTELDESIVMAIQTWRQEVEAMMNFGFLNEGPELTYLVGPEISENKDASTPTQVRRDPSLEDDVHAAQERIQSLQRQLSTRYGNLDRLREQAANFGAGQEPLALQNQIRAEMQAIQEIEAELTELKAKQSDSN